MSTLPTYDIHLFSDFFRNVDEVLGDISKAASAGLIEYIVPIAWVSLGILALVWAGAIWHGNGTSVKDWFTKMAKFVVILQFASAFYFAWVAMPLLGLPNELSAAMAKFQNVANGAGDAFTSTSAADQLTGGIEQMVLGTMQAAVDAFKDWNVGGALLLFSACVLMMIGGVLLLVAVVFNMLYAKFGMFYVLSVGPLFIFFLTVPPLKHWFTNWLNTAFYFVMLTVLSTLTMMVFTGLANKFMEKFDAAVRQGFDAQMGLAESLYSTLKTAMGGQAVQGAADTGTAIGGIVGAQMNIVSIALQMVLMFIPMFLVAMETRTLAGSLTGGSGGSFGSGVMNIVSTAWRGGIGRVAGGAGGGSGAGAGGGSGGGAGGGSGGGGGKSTG